MKIWIQVEEVDDENDHFHNTGDPFYGGEFDTAQKAFSHAATLESTPVEEDEWKKVTHEEKVKLFN